MAVGSKAAIIFGAGNIGRGFLGQLLNESGYQLTFVDIDKTLLDALNGAGHYPIRLVTNETSVELIIGPVRALAADDRASVIQALVEADLGVTAVGARALAVVASLAAAGIARRAEQGVVSPLNFIICENLKAAASVFRDQVKTALPSAYHPYLSRHIGFVEAVIARMIPSLPPEARAENPTLIIAEPYKELPLNVADFVGPPPEIVGLVPATPFVFYTERKLHIHNCGHAVLGYLGYQRGYHYAYEALLEPEVAAAAAGAMTESRLALEQKYSLRPGILAAYVEEILVRFANRALGDTTFRLARDPIRKLAPDDRLVGPALNALAQGIEPDDLVKGIVAALHFNAPEDPLAVQLQTQLQAEGLAATLLAVCGLKPGSALFQRIQQQFQAAQSLPPR